MTEGVLGNSISVEIFQGTEISSYDFQSPRQYLCIVRKVRTHAKPCDKKASWRTGTFSWSLSSSQIFLRLSLLTLLWLMHTSFSLRVFLLLSSSFMWMSLFALYLNFRRKDIIRGFVHRTLLLIRVLVLGHVTDTGFPHVKLWDRLIHCGQTSMATWSKCWPSNWHGWIFKICFTWICICR